jgi:hypothetical protein
MQATDLQTTTLTGTAKMTIEVTGRNGYKYPATQVKGDLYVVGKFIVLVEDGFCTQTACKATKANVAKYGK